MAVLQWVQENIVQFGGDPQRVTLIGHGTGAACIEYLTHSPTTVPGKNANSATFPKLDPIEKWQRNIL